MKIGVKVIEVLIATRECGGVGGLVKLIKVVEPARR